MNGSTNQTGRGAFLLFVLLVVVVLGYLALYRVEWLEQGKPRTWCPEDNDSPLNHFGPGVALSIVPLWFIVNRAFRYRGGGRAMVLSVILLGGVLLYLLGMQ